MQLIIVKRFICFMLLFSPFLGKTQYAKDIVGAPSVNYYLVGSLPPLSAGNYAKLQIDILGGNWGVGTLGVTTYYVGNRDVLTINQTTTGGGSASFSIKAYANPNGNTDIYVVTANDWYAFTVKSCMLEGDATKLQTIVQQAPVGTDVTPAVNPLFITDANGNISIGTTNARGNKLAVNGSIRAQEVKVEAANWPDYVFQPEHQLPSLESLATQIKMQGHLPNIPSAEEVSKNGVALGEMNKKLLEKVEELTLYAIRQNEQIKDLKSQSEDMKQLKELLQKQSEQLSKQQQEIESLKSKIK